MAWNVTTAFDKASYLAGETITAAISGDYTHMVQTTGFAGPLQIPLVAADGTKTYITSTQVPVTFDTEVHEAVVIDSTMPIVDTSATPRTWTISADGKSITATA